MAVWHRSRAPSVSPGPLDLEGDEQQVAAEQFQTQIIQEQARQQAEEAKGIAEAQQIITEGLSQEYLTFFYIQQLSEMPDGSVVYVPTEGGIPLIRSLGGSR